MGKIFDARGEVMSPSHATGRSGRSYRYYVSASLQRGRTPQPDGIIRRISAIEIERVMLDLINRLWPSVQRPLEAIHRIDLHASSVEIGISPDHLPQANPTQANPTQANPTQANRTQANRIQANRIQASAYLNAREADRLASRLQPGERILHSGPDMIRITLPLRFPLRGGPRQIEAGSAHSAQPDPVLIAALRKAHSMLERQRGGMPALTTAPEAAYDRMILRLALLAPDIQKAILAGTQPRGLNLERFKTLEIPLSWAEQRQRLGFIQPSLELHRP